MEEAMLEERYSRPRETIFQMLGNSTAFSKDVLTLMYQCFRESVDPTTHGPVLWAIMMKGTGVKRGVLGSHFKVYLQYYYHCLVLASQRKNVKRPLDITSLAFLTCVAAFGYSRGSEEFDKAMAANDINAINSLVVDRVNFSRFFWGGSEDGFSFLSCWRIIDNLWDLWDTNNPVKIHGFVSGTLSFNMLQSALQCNGTFLFRFSSKGGIAIDYINGNQIKKTLWKFKSIPNCQTFVNKLYDQGRDGPYLLGLIDTTDTTFGTRSHPKQQVFPLGKFVQSYTQTGYSRVSDDDDDDGPTGMNVEDNIGSFMTTNASFFG